MAAKKKRPRWPYVPCPAQGHTKAADLLATIVFAAAKRRAPNLDQIVDLALRCAAHGYSTNLPLDEHRRLVQLAQFCAESGQWSRVADHLNHD